MTPTAQQAESKAAILYLKLADFINNNTPYVLPTVKRDSARIHCEKLIASFILTRLDAPTIERGGEYLLDGSQKVWVEEITDNGLIEVSYGSSRRTVSHGRLSSHVKPLDAPTAGEHPNGSIEDWGKHYFGTPTTVAGEDDLYDEAKEYADSVNEFPHEEWKIAHRAYMAGAKTKPAPQRAADQWVNVDLVLPEVDDESYYILVTNGEEVWEESFGESLPLDEEITHWMYLPEPPTNENV
jgi:hypothetical protein